MAAKRIALGAAAVLAGIAAGTWSLHLRNRARGAATTAPPAVRQKAPFYSGSEIILPGRIQARKIVSVPAPMDGVVDAVFTDVGQEVMEGQLIARVRNAARDAALETATAEMERIQTRVNDLEASITEGRLELSRAQADASRARTDYDRTRKVFDRQQFLMKEGATPRLVFEKAQREFEAARQDFELEDAVATQAQTRLGDANRELDSARRLLEEKNLALEQARADVSSGELVAPAAGVVIGRHGQPGEEISATTGDFFQIATDLGSLDVAIDADPSVLPRVRAGQPAAVHVAEYPDEISGSVREVKGSQVLVEFTSPAPAVRPGLSAQVRIKLG